MDRSHQHEFIKTWQSEIAFAKDELMFFEDLLDRHFEKMLSEEYTTLVTQLVESLNKLSSSDIPVIERQLRSADNREQTDDDFEELKTIVTKFKDEIRSLKKQIFLTIENLLEDYQE